MITSVTDAAIRKARGEYQHIVEQLVDLDDAEQKSLIEICVAHFQNHEGDRVSPAGVANLANGIRSRRAVKKEAADWRLKDLSRQSVDWIKAHYPEAM